MCHHPWRFGGMSFANRKVGLRLCEFRLGVGMGGWEIGWRVLWGMSGGRG